jgi:hypothetical protein
MSTESCIKVFLSIMITCTNAFSSEGSLNRIARTEFFRRQSVKSFVDRREQLFAKERVTLRSSSKVTI